MDYNNNDNPNGFNTNPNDFDNEYANNYNEYPQNTFGANDNNRYPTYSSDLPGKGKATASLVLGVISLVLAWMGWFSVLAFVLAIIGAVQGSQARRIMPAGTTGRATAGMVLSILAIVISILGFIASIWFYTYYGSGFWGYYYW